MSQGNEHIRNGWTSPKTCDEHPKKMKENENYKKNSEEYYEKI